MTKLEEVLAAADRVIAAYASEPGGVPTARYEGHYSDTCMFCESDTWQDGALIHEDFCEWAGLMRAVAAARDERNA